VPDYFPDWVSRAEVGKQHGTLTHVICDKPATLIYLANQACIEPHVFLSRVASLGHPDQLVFDLDPPDDEHFDDARRAALALRDLLEGELGLTSFVKTTGGKGTGSLDQLRPGTPVSMVWMALYCRSSSSRAPFTPLKCGGSCIRLPVLGSGSLMVTQIRETERKYEAGPGTRLPALSELPMVAMESDSPEQTLEAEYYDTADLRLIRAGVTLRRRRGGSDPGWHLKLPAGGDSRDEIRLPLGGAGRKVPAELATLVRVHTRGEELRPVALITTRRQLRVLLDDSGSSLAEVAADDVSAQAMGEEATLSRWHEVEVELTGGSARLLEAADKALRRSGLRPAQQQAKLERALADQLPPAGQLWAGGPRHRPTKHSAAAEVILGYAGAEMAALKAADPLVRRDTPGSVHQMRVAARRLRATLKSFRTVLDPAETRSLGEELKWLGTVLGAPRDAEVLAARVTASVQQLPPELVLGPVQARLRAHFAPVEAATRAAALKALDSERYLALLDRLDLLLTDPPLAAEASWPAAEVMPTAKEVLPAAVRRMHRRVRRRMRHAQALPAGPDRDVALHEARKAAKDARYAAEALSPAFGKQARRFASQMKKVQSVLGDQHDAVVARGTVRELGVQAHLAGENAFSFGIVHQRDSELAERLDRQASRAWKRASRHKYSSWLRLSDYPDGSPPSRGGTRITLSAPCSGVPRWLSRRRQVPASEPRPTGSSCTRASRSTTLPPSPATWPRSVSATCTARPICRPPRAARTATTWSTTGT